MSDHTATAKLHEFKNENNPCVDMSNDQIIKFIGKTINPFTIYFFTNDSHKTMAGRAVFPKNNPDDEFSDATIDKDKMNNNTIAAINYANTPSPASDSLHPFSISIWDDQKNTTFTIDPKIQNQPPQNKGTLGGLLEALGRWWIAITVAALAILAVLGLNLNARLRRGK